MKEQFTLVSMPMDWRNPDNETIVGIGLPMDTARKVGAMFPESDVPLLVRDLFEKETGSNHNSDILNVKVLNHSFSVGGIFIVAGAVFEKQKRKVAEDKTTKVVNLLNSLNFSLS